jgi:hypothetical protein
MCWLARGAPVSLLNTGLYVYAWAFPSFPRILRFVASAALQPETDPLQFSESPFLSLRVRSRWINRIGVPTKSNFARI